jgi:hypothetical protein
MKYTLVVDADTIIFRYAKILQEDYVEVWWKDRMKIFKNKTMFKGGTIKGEKIKGWLYEKERPFKLDEFKFVNKSKPLFSHIGVAQKHIAGYIEELYNIPWVKDIKFVLGGGDNFRYKIYPDYKKNRGEKPLKLQEVKDWVCSEYKDIVVIAEGVEADDYLSIMGHWSRNHFKNPKDTNIVLCGCDKDLLQIHSNYFFNFDKREDGIIWIDEFTGHKSLAIQILTGDITDNIKGLPKVTDEMKEKYNIRGGGCGKMKAEKILSNSDTIIDLYRQVQWCYMSYYKEQYKTHLNREFQLVKLLEKKNEIPTFPFQVDK